MVCGGVARLSWFVETSLNCHSYGRLQERSTLEVNEKTELVTPRDEQEKTLKQLQTPLLLYENLFCYVLPKPSAHFALQIRTLGENDLDDDSEKKRPGVKQLSSCDVDRDRHEWKLWRILRPIQVQKLVGFLRGDTNSGNNLEGVVLLGWARSLPVLVEILIKWEGQFSRLRDKDFGARAWIGRGWAGLLL